MSIKYTSDHIHLRSPNPEKTAHFYVDALKAQEINRAEIHGALRIVVDLGGFKLFIEQVSTPAPLWALRARAANLSRA
jgi:lactoylglutathione lyase